MSNSPVPADDLKFAMLVLLDEMSSPLPLEHTQVNAHLTGLIASVTVVQSFSNPRDEPVELEYLFPLPESAAIVDFSVHIGDRLVRGEVRENEQAREAYDQARGAGMHAALLEQRRSNLFAVRLANVLPHELIRTSLQYEGRLILRPGELEFVFPMGITPKYHDVTHPDEAQGVNPPFASASEKIGQVDIQITADLGPGMGEPLSPSHLLEVERMGEGRYSLHLKGATLPDHDFVLRFPTSSAPVEVAAWTAHDPSGEFFLANWLPGLPQNSDTREAAALPREFIFVLDRSGSMEGQPIRQARNALRACLRILDAQDAFRILLFDDELEWYQPDAVIVTQAAVDQADTFLNGVEGRGGTEILQALDAALSLPADAIRTRTILFLTDGAVSADERTLAAIRQKLNQARVFTFGIGPSVNRALLTRMAELGRGMAEFLQLDEDIEGAILRFQDMVSFPVLTDIRVEWQQCKVWDVYPALLPDLYAGQTLQMTGRMQRKPGDGPALLRITARRGSEILKMEVTLPEVDRDAPEVTRAWARARVDDLLNQSSAQISPVHKIRQEIISLALEHHLVTPYTAFVAVDQDIVNSGGRMLTLAIAQPLPKGLERSGFFSSPGVIPASPMSMSGKLMMISETQYDVGDAQQLGDVEQPAAPGVQSAPSHPAPEAMHSFLRNHASHNAGLIGGGLSHQVGESQLENPEEILHWLARTQNLDGSWPGGIEFTAAALLAFVRGGQTHRRGHYRKQVQRAADWLARVSTSGTSAYAQALALVELAQLEKDAQIQAAAQSIASALAAPSGAFQLAISALFQPTDQSPTPPQRITQLEDLRAAAALHLHLAVPPDLLSADTSRLTLVWSLLV